MFEEDEMRWDGAGSENYPIEAIHWAGMGDSCIDDLKALLKRRPDFVNAKNTFGDSPLIVAARVGAKKVAEFLVSFKEADVDRRVEEGSALTIAASRGDLGIADILVRRGADLEIRGKWGMTPLLHAAAAGAAELVGLLLSAGADAGVKDFTGRSAFSIATTALTEGKEGGLRTIRLLLGNPHRGVLDEATVDEAFFWARRHVGKTKDLLEAAGLEMRSSLDSGGELDKSKSMEASKNEAEAKLKAFAASGTKLLEYAVSAGVPIFGKNGMNKGWRGTAVERLLGLSQGNSKGSDFPDLEVKTVPVRFSKGRVSAKETTCLCVLDANEMGRSSFKDSGIYAKMKNTLFVLIDVEDENDPKIAGTRCVRLEDHPDLLEQMEKDYEEIAEHILDGLDEHGFNVSLTGKLGKVMQPRPKTGKKGSYSWAFYLKKKAVDELLNHGLEASKKPSP